MELATITLTALALLGLLISTYFTAISYRWVEPSAAWIPSFCRMGEKTCATIVFTPRARLFGVPNSLLGQVYYVALLAGLWGGFLFSRPAFFLYLSASLLTVLVGVFLSYSLLFITRVPCTLCFTSHAINAMVLVLLLIG